MGPDLLDVAVDILAAYVVSASVTVVLSTDPDTEVAEEATMAAAISRSRSLAAFLNLRASVAAIASFSRMIQVIQWIRNVKAHTGAFPCHIKRKI